MEKLFESIEEHPEPQEAEITGSIPDWVEGYLFRAGPAKWDFEDGFTLNHYGDGTSLMNKFTIEKGKVTVMTKFLDSEAYQKLLQFNRPIFTEYGTRSYPDLCKNIFQRFIATFLPMSFTDNNFDNFLMLEDEMYLISEKNSYWKINSDDLTAIEKTDISNVVSVNAATSHPHIAQDGTIYNIGSSVMTGMKYNIFKTPPKSADGLSALQRTTMLSTISSSYTTCLSYYHSFGLSENYILLVEQPYLINTLKMATSGIVGYCFHDLMDWYPDEKAIFRLIDRETGIEIETKYVTNAFFFFHHINTYEEDGHLVSDLVTYSDPDVVNHLLLEKLRLGTFPMAIVAGLTRFVLPLNTEGKQGSNLVTLKNTKAIAVKQDENSVLLIPETKGKKGFEFPAINYSMFNSKKYRYVYGSSVFNRAELANSVQYCILLNF
ncbi:beta,beta-carotene 9',10'-oxygenase [Trichonephila clavata]|uniref:Beta,beta-carotene 9',10'-oxygenase n=1 Tax=Trichonephila clavata TaxID=2740835 RepID=A0A8X6F0K4_TRICU|nr:beta,beta-carotene 9',10'-oxygenase [Trichonephila clavata]